MIQESTGSALRNTEKWEVWLPPERNTEDSEPRETETIREDLLTKPTIREEIKSNWEDTDNKIIIYIYFLLLLVNGNLRVRNFDW